MSKTDNLQNHSDIAYTNKNQKNNTTNLNMNLNIGKVIYIGLIFMIQFSAWNGLQNLLGLVLQQLGYDYMGLITLLSTYLSFGIASMIAPRFCKILPYRYTFAISCGTMLIFMYMCIKITECSGLEEEISSFCSEIVLTISMFSVSLIIGSSFSVLWVTQSVYVTKCSNDFNKGKMFGIFWSLMQASQIIGNALASYFYEKQGARGLFQFMFLLCLIATILYLFVQTPDNTSTTIYDANKEAIIEMATKSNSINDKLLDDSVHNYEAYYVNKTDRSIEYTWDMTYKFMRQSKFLSFIPMFLLSSYSLCIIIIYIAPLTDYSVSYLSPEERSEHVGYVLFVLGISEVAAGQIFGYILDKDRVFAVKMMFLVNYGAIFMLFIAYWLNTYWLYFIVAMFYGMCDSGSQTVFGALISSTFSEKFEAFAGFEVVFCISLGIYFFAHLYINGNAMISLTIYFALATYGYRNIMSVFRKV